MNKSELVDALAARLDGDKKAAGAAIDSLVDLIQRSVVKGEKVSIAGFGVFEKRPRAARVARNPATGASIKLKKTSVPAFRPGTQFKAVVGGGVKLGAAPKVAKAAPAKKVTAAKPAVKKASVAKKTAAVKKSAAKAAPAKKVTAAKPAVKKASVAKKTVAVKKSAAKAAPVRKNTAAKKTTAKAAPAKKATVAKPAAKKTVARKAPAKKK